jgi:hypothetical protein
MTSETARRRSARSLAAACALALASTGCAGYFEVPIEMPVQSKIDTTRFRRVLIAGFASELSGADVEVASETVRLLQNQLRSSSRLQVVEADRPPLEDALADARNRLGESGGITKEEREQFQLETDRILTDQEYWRKVGEEFQGPLIVTGRVGFEEQNRSGFQTEERVVRDPGTNRSRLVRGSRYQERKGFVLSADFHFVDGRTGETLHKEKFTEEVLYGEEQKVSALSSYFELMDRLLPNFLGVISPQRIRGTRILLR